MVNLAHLAHLIKNSTERFIKLELEWNKVSDVLRRRLAVQVFLWVLPVCMVHAGLAAVSAQSISAGRVSQPHLWVFELACIQY